MTPEALNAKVSKFAMTVVRDDRWGGAADDLGVAVLGMILYGYALAVGRLVMLLEIECVAKATEKVLVEVVGAASKWSEGLVRDAETSAFDRAYHPQQFELVGVGHSYYGVNDSSSIVDNVFTNIDAVRSRSRAAT